CASTAPRRPSPWSRRRRSTPPCPPAPRPAGSQSPRPAAPTSATDFTVVPPAPTITTFSPTSGQVGAAVTITGTNFNGATSVRFNGTAATFTVVSATQINTSVPSGATTGRITVTTPGGTATSATDFTVV